MEIVFLIILIGLMVAALSSGFPVAFSLPGSAILAITLAALTGYAFEGDASAYFAQDGPVEWLSAGVTNFRSLYWDVERDTLIAIPLFVFMGIMLQRSKIAEDLLVAMAQLFGPVPGGLGISVVFVGALLAATTGIVGATVIAMGLISLPAMLRNNYSPSLASGTICASGTLGQIIPPSIVLIILADQLASAADQASTIRKAAYKNATGEFSMPSALDITSASAGDMFMGAFIPGMILVGLYMLYILVSAILRPGTAPPVPFDGAYDRRFLGRVLISLVPPLTLIFAVLGSIILGIATVNQAGAIGAVGAMIMGGYRLTEGKRGSFAPAILAGISLMGIMLALQFYDINVKSINNEEDLMGVRLAAVASTGLMIAVIWSMWRAYRIDDTLRGVMMETAKTTSMVFIILIGAAMLTSAFRAFGGEELVKHFLTGLPGGFWTQFIVVMAVMFVLGFFLDFIEIAVVVVPIVAPILLADPGANITAVWLGVMVGLNIQTSFLTPPFGFALFYLRGVAPPSVRTTQIYKGAVAFIALQLVGLGIAGYFPSLVNYLPYRTYLTSETAPPPINPRLQLCMREQVFAKFAEQGSALRSSIEKASALDLSMVPEDMGRAFKEGLDNASATFDLSAAVQQANTAITAFEPEYRPLHGQVRGIEASIRKIKERLGSINQSYLRESRGANPKQDSLLAIKARATELETELATLERSVPAEWEALDNRFRELKDIEKKAINQYNRNVDAAYEPLAKLRKLVFSASDLAALEEQFAIVQNIIDNDLSEQAIDKFKEIESLFSAVDGASAVKSKLSKARRALDDNEPDRNKATNLLTEGRVIFDEELAWRKKAEQELAPGLNTYNNAIADNIGLRLQDRLPLDDAKAIALCQSEHRDVSLNF